MQGSISIIEKYIYSIILVYKIDLPPWVYIYWYGRYICLDGKALHINSNVVWDMYMWYIRLYLHNAGKVLYCMQDYIVR